MKIHLDHEKHFDPIDAVTINGLTVHHCLVRNSLKPLLSVGSNTNCAAVFVDLI